MVLSERIITAVADKEEVEPWNLDPPLYEVIDPDVIDELYQSSCNDEHDTELSLAFSYAGYRVTITDGDVQVTTR